MLRDIRTHLGTYLDLKRREREEARQALALLDSNFRSDESCGELK